MIKTFTVRDRENPDVLLDIDIKEEDEEEEKEEEVLERRYFDDIGYKSKPFDKGKEEDEEPTKKKKKKTKINENAKQEAKKELLDKRHVYRFISMYGAQLGIYKIEKMFKDPEKKWEDQMIYDSANGSDYFVTESDAEILEQSLNGIYYGVLENAWSSIEIFNRRKISLSHIVESVRYEPKIPSMFLKYAVTMYRAGTVGGFSAQPGRVYTKNGSVALNVHAGTAHRQEIQQQSNLFQIWFHKVHSKSYKSGDNFLTFLHVVDFSGPNTLSNFVTAEMKRRGFDNAVEVEVVEEDGIVKKEKF
jgi:hypothetical protein